MIKPTLTHLIDEYLETSARAGSLLSDISTRFSLGRGRENSKRYWKATRRLQLMLMNDYFRDMKASPGLKTRSYLLTQNKDGSLALTDVQLKSLQKHSEAENILQCLVTSRTV